VALFFCETKKQNGGNLKKPPEDYFVIYKIISGSINLIHPHLLEFMPVIASDLKERGNL